MSSPVTVKVFPSQKKTDSEKNQQWKEDSVDAGESMVLLQNHYTRTSRYNKKINYDLYAGKLHPSDMQKIMNPMGLKDVTFPAQPKNYPITNPYLKSLIGEEIKRRFDWKLKVENDEAVTEKEKAKAEIVKQELQEILTQGLDENTPPEQVEQRLGQLNKYLNYEWQDIRELAGTRLLKYYQSKLNLKDIFSRGFEDGLISAEEIYCIDVIENEPIVRKCNPINIYYLLPPDSYKIEDADIIVEERYIPLSQVLDTYFKYLTPADIDFLEARTGFKANETYGNIPNYELQDPVFSIPLGAATGVDIANLQTGSNSFAPFDSANNVRVVRVVWRSMRRIGILSYFDEAGNQLERVVSDKYKIDKSQGETIKYEWIGEWWEGTKIANKLYVKIEPRPVQFRGLNNISKCASGYVGSVYKTNSSAPQSLLDIMKPYQYSYVLYMYRTELAFIKNKGKIPNLDLAKIPDGWTPDKWMYFFEIMGFSVMDSFKEAKKGAATGKIVGNMSGQADVINLEQGQYIKQHIDMLMYIESQLDKISGITPQRRGMITSADQGLGVTQESRQASATITEWYFNIHDNTKIRVLEALLETCKYCLREDNKNIQYIEDDMTTMIYKLDGEMINEADYGLILRDAISDMDAIQMLRKATEIALQTGQVDLIQLMDIYSNDSLASMRRKIERSIGEKKQQAAQEAQQQQQNAMQLQQQQIAAAQQAAEQEMLIKQRELDLQQYKIDTEAQTKITVAEIGVYARQQELDLNMSGVPDPIEIANQALEERKHMSESYQKESDRLSKQRVEEHKARLKELEIKSKKDLEEKKIALEEKKMKNDKAIEELKAKTAITVAKTNKTRYDK